MTQITVQNLSTVITDEEAERITAALNVQATRDYNGSPWVTGNLAGAIGSVTFLSREQHPTTAAPGSWHLEILDTSDQPGALGYHEEQAFNNQAGSGQLAKASGRSSRGLRADAPDLPLMKVFAKTSNEDGASLAEVCSHELLEAAVDPRPMREPRTVVNQAKQQKVIVEVGDPVQECGYQIDGVTVADFAEPAWFGYPGTRMSFRESVKQPFELAPGGYISVCPVGTESWEQVFGNTQAAEMGAMYQRHHQGICAWPHHHHEDGDVLEQLYQLKREVKAMSTVIQDIATDAAKIAEALPQIAAVIETKDTEITERDATIAELEAKINSGEVVDPAEGAAVKMSLDEVVQQAEALIPAPPAPAGPTGPVFTLTAGDPVPAEAEVSGFQTLPAEGEAEALYYSPNGEVEGLVAYTGETAPVPA